jgi:hypothetical protein
MVDIANQLKVEGEDVILTFEREGDDEAIDFQAKVNNISFGGGAASTDEVYLFGGNTINFQKPREKFTVTVEGITADTKFDFIHMNSTETGAKISALEGKEVRSDAQSDKRWRIGCWFCPKANHKSTSTTLDGQTYKLVVPHKKYWIYRWLFIDAKAVTMDTSFSADDMLKFTLNFELSATDENGYPNVIKEYTSAQGTTALTVLNTTAHRGTLTWNTTTPAWTASYRT